MRRCTNGGNDPAYRGAVQLSKDEDFKKGAEQWCDALMLGIGGTILDHQLEKLATAASLVNSIFKCEEQIKSFTSHRIWRSTFEKKLETLFKDMSNKITNIPEPLNKLKNQLHKSMQKAQSEITTAYSTYKKTAKRSVLHFFNKKIKTARTNLINEIQQAISDLTKFLSTLGYDSNKFVTLLKELSKKCEKDKKQVSISPTT